MQAEASYRPQLIERIRQRFPNCVVMPTDPRRQQGVPDILLLFERCWAMLEIKKTSKASRRPNQEHYVDKYNNMSFAAVIYPENEERVLDELQSTLGL